MPIHTTDQSSNQHCHHQPPPPPPTARTYHLIIPSNHKHTTPTESHCGRVCRVRLGVDGSGTNHQQGRTQHPHHTNPQGVPAAPRAACFRQQGADSGADTGACGQGQRRRRLRRVCVWRVGMCNATVFVVSALEQSAKAGCCSLHAVAVWVCVEGVGSSQLCLRIKSCLIGCRLDLGCWALENALTLLVSLWACATKQAD